MHASRRRRFRVSLVAVAIVALSIGMSDPGLGATAEAGQPAAVVCLIQGTATVADGRSEAPRKLELLDLLDAGTVVETAPAGSVVIALANGQRFRIEGNSRVAIRLDGVEVDSGNARDLAPVPAMVRLSPIVSGENASVAGTGRIRNDGSQRRAELVLAPPTGTWVVADDLVLEFNPVEGYTLYRVTVERGWGETVFDIKTRSSSLTVPGDTLEPGGTYHWSAQTLDPDRPRLHAGAVFFTLEEKQSRARAEIVAQTETSDDPSLRILLAAVDHGLGLQREACASLEQALHLGADAPAVAVVQESYGCPAAAETP